MRIALCGSTRFKSTFESWNHALAISGHTVYSLSLFGREATDIGKEGNVIISESEKVTLDLVHLDKILNSQAIVIIDVGGYIGFSTKREIEWARLQRKNIYWITTDRFTVDWDSGDSLADILLRKDVKAK